ncbi:TIGR00270 family protein [Candidatus Woesearchaeota archaeon]|nr:TIGR00270 family protein [Candidatus Woesearchaeota archaeon]
MPTCDLCGRELEKLLRAEIEGTELAVCGECGKHGTILGKVKKKVSIVVPKKKTIIREEIEERVVVDFSDMIRRVREKKGWNQEEFAKFLNEKWSVVQKWESNSLTPELNVARRLERVLRVDLVERVKEEKIDLKGIKSGEMTMADLITVRKRKF